MYKDFIILMAFPFDLEAWHGRVRHLYIFQSVIVD